jgi:two-component system, cell cycle sensor histidine kinase and response regulator CckA
VAKIMSLRIKTILLVDDEAAVREQMRRALRSAGYRILVASDYGAALASFQQHPGEIDLVVTDIAMPGRHGYELVLSLRAIQPGLKVLVTSAQSGAEWGRFCSMNESNTYFLEKPFNEIELLAAARNFLEEPERGTATTAV